MANIKNLNLNYDRAIKIADDVYWVGFLDVQSGLHCNPYLIIDGDEAVVIDGGSRPHFPVVMMKILQTGVDPSSITALIYQHYDPDLCGSIPNFEDLIGREDLQIISDAENNIFIRYYSVQSKLRAIKGLDYRFKFASGRELRFYPTPYAHSAGSFITFDEKTGILFSSDLFGSYSGQWELFLDMAPECRECEDFSTCKVGRAYCPLPDIFKFHQTIMTSMRALRYSMEQIAQIPFHTVAPQHGSVIHEAKDILKITEKLVTLEDVGIDRIIGDRLIVDIGDISRLTERLGGDDS